MNKFTHRPEIDGFRAFINEQFKTFFDYIHYTPEGARYFGKVIYDTNWLKPLDQLFE